MNFGELRLPFQYELASSGFLGMLAVPPGETAADVFPKLRSAAYTIVASAPTTSSSTTTAVTTTSTTSTTTWASPAAPAGSAGPASTQLAPAIAGAAAGIVVLVLLFLYVRRRRGRSLNEKQEELELELGQAANSRARAQFGREYGHALRNAEVFEMELMELALDRQSIKFDTRVAAGAEGEVWHGHVAQQGHSHASLYTRNPGFHALSSSARPSPGAPLEVRPEEGAARHRPAPSGTEAVMVHRLTARDSEAQAKFLVQMRLHYLLGRHPNVQRLLGAVTFGSPLLVVLEPTPQGQLGSFLRLAQQQDGGLPNRDLMVILRQVASAMAHLESLSIVHRGLGLESIFVAGGPANVKLAGFAAARDVYSRDVYVASTSLVRDAGPAAGPRDAGAHPLRYLSPECLDDGVYTSKSDMWAFGVLMGEVFAQGEPLFQGYSVEALASAIRRGALPELHVDAPELADTLRQASLRRRPEARPSFADMYAQLASAPCDASDDAWSLVQPLEVGRALSAPAAAAPPSEAAPRRQHTSRFLSNLSPGALRLGPTVVSGGGSGPFGIWTARTVASASMAAAKPPPALWVQTVRSNQDVATRTHWGSLAELLLRLPHAHLLPVVGTVRLPPAKASTATAAGGQGGLAPAGGLALLHRVAYPWRAWAALQPSLTSSRRRAMLTVPVLMALEHLAARRVYAQAVSLQHVFVLQGRVRLGGLPLTRDLAHGEAAVIGAVAAYLTEIQSNVVELRADTAVAKLQEACRRAAASCMAPAAVATGGETFENDGEAGAGGAAAAAQALPLSQLVLLAQDLCGDGARWEVSWDSLTFVRHLGEGNFGEVSLMALDGRLASPNAGVLPASGVGEDAGAGRGQADVQPRAPGGKARPSRRSRGANAVAPAAPPQDAALQARGPQAADSHTLVAAKMLLDDTQQSEFESEVRLMMRVRHPNLVSLLHVVTAERPRALIMEYLPGGALDDWLAGAQGRDALAEDLLFILHQVASGMAELSRLDIVHRDLAARNILIGGGLQAKVSDFGLSRIMDGGQGQYYRLKTSRPMPVRWMPPELLRDRVASSVTDVYSFGMVIQEVFSRGKVPLGSLGDVDVVKHLADALTRAQAPNVDEVYIVDQPGPGCPPGVARLMRECIRLVPSHRPTFASLVQQTLPQRWPALLGAAAASKARRPSATTLVVGERPGAQRRQPPTTMLLAQPRPPVIDLSMDADESRL
ncbi:MAG: hypothetical protein CML43_13980 [Rhodobacteraceae bacterium]|nr:hypothetical protein [Paracoccaceae bacterium]